MAEADLAPRVVDIRSDGNQLGYLAAKSLLTNNGLVTAILAGSDQVAAGVYTALQELEIRVPDEMSVVGFNDTHGALLTPQLTSVREFPEELGRHLAQFVLARVQNPLLPAQEFTIPTQMVHRDSVRSPADGHAIASGARPSRQAKTALSVGR
jgi:DNA-binding LacI/PurR family transcriptional regulator